ncbi:MAG: nucleotidyl transferase AbiEii/AbiGii toxin family protein [Kiritimatiellae bacterium]|nr:nucleotidyl transferase AbiEii/AbiGii toxin family protein [Kiritimatiellia bacterium]
MKREIINMGHSVRTRLKMLAKANGRDANYLFQRYAFERFYYRIGKSPYANNFILKGAALFSVWIGPMFRVTQDTDLESTLTPDHERMKAVFREIAQIEVTCDDGVRYDISSIEISDIKAEDEYKGIRIKFNAYIEQARIRLQFDIGFGDSIYPRAVLAEYPTLLGGDAPQLKVYPQYSVVAEKASVMFTRGMDNSRLKDYFDIWALSETFAFDKGVLKTAVARTFRRNGIEMTEAWPVGLTDRFAQSPMKLSQWNAFLRKTEPRSSPESLTVAVERIRELLAPIFWEKETTMMTWSPVDKRWNHKK